LVPACDEVVQFFDSIRFETGRALCRHPHHQPFHGSGPEGNDDALAHGKPLTHPIRNQVGERPRDAAGHDHIRIERRVRDLIRKRRDSGVGHTAF
jgi:hypothetical protein